jgi:hypothetical protein
MSSEAQLGKLVEASHDVVPEPPLRLLRHIEAMPSSLSTLSNFEDLHSALCIIEHPRRSVPPMRQVSIDPGQLGLMRWLIDGLSAWTPAGDPGHVQLVALLVVLQAFGSTRDVWKALPEEIGKNNSLIAALEAAVLSSHVTLSPAPGAAIWEAEAVAAMALADKMHDWEAIADSWQSFEPIMHAEPFLSLAARGIARFRFDRLVPATRNHATIVDCMRLARTLSNEERLRLATMTTNEHLRFGCAYAASLDTPRNEPLTTTAQGLLADVFVAVSQDLSNWQKWLAVFARHSVRHGPVQAPLGAALALVSPLAVEAYVGSIDLQVGGSVSRNNVTACLRAFRVKANAPRQAHMWKVAFERWDRWNFGLDNAETLVSGLKRSDLDFAVVGHAVALSAYERSRKLERLRDQLVTHDNVWHRSHIEMLSHWFRVLSKMQPFAHADHVLGSGGDWLAIDAAHLPYEPENPYIRLRYGSIDRR